MGIPMLTAEERVLLHLLGHVRHAERYEAPFELTQAGIALATSVRRSHVSATLKEMESRGLVDRRVSHIEGGARRRKVYVLSARGVQAAESIRQRVAATPVRWRTGGEVRPTTLGEAVRASRGGSLVTLALAVRDGLLDLETPRPLDRPLAAPRFYGRVTELAQFREFLASACACLALRGLAGTGKSAFLVAATSGTDPSRLLWVRAAEGTTPEQLVAAIAGKLRELGRPALSQMREYGASPEDLLARAVRETSEAPLLLVIDGAEKTRDALAPFLGRLLAGLRGSAGKLVVAGRQLPHFYSRRDVLLDGSVRELEMSTLDDAAALAILASRGVPEARRDEVLAVTRGHPLFLELMAATGGRGLGDIRKYLREEVASQLGPREEELLATLAVQRHPIPSEAVVLELADSGRLEALQERGLVRLGGGVVEMHDLLKEFFASRLSGAQRRRLHLAAAAYYETRPDPEDRLEQLHHLERAGEVEELVELLAGTGRSLAARGFQEEVLRLIAQIDLASLAAEDRVPLLLLEGEVCATRGSWDRARQRFSEAAGLAEEIGDGRGRARAVLEAGVLEYRRGDVEAARASFQRALDIVGDSDEAITARILNAFGILEWQAGDLDSAAAFYDRSRKAYERASDLAGVAGAINNLGILRWQRGDVDGALSLYAESLKISESLGDDRTVSILYNNIGEAYRRRGDSDNAARFYDRSLQLAERLEFVWQIGEIHRNLGRLLSGPKGRGHLEQALAIFESLGARRDKDEVLALLQDQAAGGKK